MVLATTPGDTVACRGMFALCCPHRHTHFVWGPVSALTEHPARLSARLMSRSFIAFTMRVSLARLDVKIKQD